MAGLLVFESFSNRRTLGVCGAMSKMFVGGCWYFLEKCWKTGGKRTRCPRQPTVDMDVDCRRPCHDENYSSLFVENSHPETRPQGVMFHPPWAFVRFTTALRYEPCPQFINVSQRTHHIYFIDGCRRIKIERNNLLCEQAPTEVFRSIFAWLVTLNLQNI